MAADITFDVWEEYLKARCTVFINKCSCCMIHKLLSETRT